MKVLVVHTLPPEAGADGRISDEFDLAGGANVVASVLPGAIVCGILGRPEEFVELVKVHRPDVVFNLCEAPLGKPELEAHAAALWEWLGIRFTGSPSETLALCRVKDRVNAVLAANGIPVPGSGSFPCLVKPAEQDGSAWIWKDSICHDDDQVRQAVSRIPGRALVEAFMPGREFAVSAWGKERAEHFSIGETAFANGLQLLTYEGKWFPESSDYVDSPVTYAAQVDAELRGQLEEIVSRVWKVVGARGYMRVDLRLDVAGVPHVIDVNPNSALSEQGGIRAAVLEAGWSWERFVQCQVEWAC